MKKHGNRPNQARNLQRHRKSTARADIGSTGGLCRVIVGTAPRAWNVDAANDPQA